MSPDERLVAWAEDRKGNESYFLRVRNIATGKDLLAQPVAVRIPWCFIRGLCQTALTGREASLQPCPDFASVIVVWPT